MLAAVVGRAVPLGLVSLSLLAAPCLADEFTNPANSYLDLQKHYKFGETYPITWKTSLEYITLELRHWSDKGEIVGVLALYIPNSGIFDWTVGEHDNVNSKEIAKNPHFNFVITDPSGKINSSTTGGGFLKGLLQSRAFIIDDVTSTSTTSTTTSASSAPTLSAPTSTTPTETSQTATGATDGGLTQQTKIGIGVGVGVGAPSLIVLAIAITVLVMRRRQREKNISTYGAAAVEHRDKPPEIGEDHRGELSIQNYSEPPSEMPGYPDLHTGRLS